MNYQRDLNQLNNLYAQVEQLKSLQAGANYRTVFTDISNEWANCSDEEQKFINNDADYIHANEVYQQQFSAFLIDMFGTQFANSQYGTSAEKVLMSIRNAKKRFKDKSIESAVNMEQQNKELMESNKRLEAQLRSFKELLGDKLNVGR